MGSSAKSSGSVWTCWDGMGTVMGVEIDLGLFVPELFVCDCCNPRWVKVLAKQSAMC